MVVTGRTVPSSVVATVLGAAAFFLTGADLRQHYLVDPGLPLAFSVAWAVVVAAAVLVAGRVVAPVVVLVVAWAVAAVSMVGTYPRSPAEPWPWSVGATAAVVVVLVALGLRTGRSRRPVLAVAWLGTQAVGAGAVLSDDQLGRWSSLVTAGVLTAVAVVVGDLLGARRADRLDREASRREAADAVAARREADERRELAHELHDVVAHHLSVVVVRADSAPARVGGLDAAARAEFTAIGDDARVCLEQMRRVVRVLAGDDPEPAPTAPQPGLRQLVDLVAGARSAGATVDLDLTVDDRPPLDDLTALTAYRVAQEALTNALRHAPSAPVSVAVRGDGDALVVEVTNPAGDPVPTSATPGRGLAGMRERVAVVDGTVDANPTADGGFRVRAVLPRAHPARPEATG